MLRLITFERENNDGVLNDFGFNEALDQLVNFPEDEEDKLPGTIKVTTPIATVSMDSDGKTEEPLKIETDLTRKQEEEKAKEEARRRRSSTNSFSASNTDVYEDPLLTQSVLDTVVEKAPIDDIDVKPISATIQEMTEKSKETSLGETANPFATSTSVNAFSNSSLLSTIPMTSNQTFGASAFSDINGFNSMPSVSNMLDDMSNFLNDADLERRRRNANKESSENNNNNSTYNEEDMYSSPWA